MLMDLSRGKESLALALGVTLALTGLLCLAQVLFVVIRLLIEIYPCIDIRPLWRKLWRFIEAKFTFSEWCLATTP